MINSHRASLLALIAVSLSGIAFAQSTTGNDAQQWSLTNPWSGAKGRSGWRIDALAGLEAEGNFGSENQQTTSPFGQAHTPESGENLNGLFRAMYEGTGGRRYFAIVEKESASAGLWWPWREDWLIGSTLAYSEGVEYNGEGTPNIFFQTIFPAQSSLDLGVSLARRLGDFSLIAGLQTDVQNSNGVSGSLGARWDRLFAENFRVAAIGDVSLGDSTNLFSDFGVAPEQAGASGLAQYNPGEGLRSSRLGFELEYQFRDDWSVFTNANAQYFYSNARDSPRIGGGGTESSENANYSATIGVRYRFDQL